MLEAQNGSKKEMKAQLEDENTTDIVGQQEVTLSWTEEDRGSWRTVVEDYFLL